MKLPKRHHRCKTCGNVFRYESKNEIHCPPCRPASGPRRHLAELMEEQGRICPFCDKALPEEIDASIHVDHRWPKAFGGTDDYENLQAMHTPCNRLKNASLAPEVCLVVKDILHAVVDGSRVSIEGPQSDFSIILDGDSRKPVCRLWARKPHVHLGLFDENEGVMRNEVESFDDIYAFAEEIRSTARRYLMDEQ